MSNSIDDTSKTRAVIFDPANRRWIEIKDSVLVNQMSRDASNIALSFDALCEDDLCEISSEFATTYGLIVTGLMVSSQDEDELRLACAELLSNALNTIAAAASLLRTGYVLQPGILIRSCLEAISVALHLIQNENDLDAYRAHTLDSTRTISSARRVVPPFGHCYGFFSREFVHIGRLHKSITQIVVYRERDEALELNLCFLRFGTWLAYVASELIFFASLSAHRYWTHDGAGFRYAPSEEEQARMSRFLRIGGV